MEDYFNSKALLLKDFSLKEFESDCYFRSIKFI